MSQYCRTNTARDTVEEGPTILPTTYQGIVNFHLLTDPQLLTYYWYPYVLVDTGAPGPYYYQSLSPFDIQATQVQQTASYTQWDIEEVRRLKNSELEQQVRTFEANEVAATAKITDYVREDTEWLSQKQAELARLTDWNDVANFDTTKPAVVTFRNDFVGQSYVNQGVRMTSENQAATGAGLTAPWDQTIVNNFVSANQTAAQDSSGATAPTPPTFEIRQGVANPNEQAARVIIWREARDDPNPALRTTYKMRLFNRQDNRNLYVFSYIGTTTYLTWRQFEAIAGSDDWGLEATAAEWQYVPGDMSFIFSYGTNPAVTSDYFTDRVLFPAGVQEKNVIVAWDPV